MKNTRSGTPRARGCSWPVVVAPLPGAAADGAAGSMMDMTALSSIGRRGRRLVVCSPAPVQDEVGQDGGHLGHGRHRHPLVDAVDVLGRGPKQIAGMPRRTKWRASVVAVVARSAGAVPWTPR